MCGRCHMYLPKCHQITMMCDGGSPTTVRPFVYTEVATDELHRLRADLTASTARIAELESQNAELVMQNAGLGGRVAACEALLEEASGDAARMSAVIAAMDAFASAHERWEADLILCNKAWTTTDLPKFTDKLWDRALELQAARNTARAAKTAMEEIDHKGTPG